MKTSVLFMAATTFICTSTLAYDCDCDYKDKDTRRYLEYNNRNGFDNSNDGFVTYRFESLQTHGYRRYHGYDREDEGTINNPKFGYAWESVH